MVKTVEAVIDNQGKVRLLRGVHLGSPHRALVVILDELGPASEETALLSEEALSDWTKPEEDAAWSYLQQEK